MDHSTAQPTSERHKFTIGIGDSQLKAIHLLYVLVSGLVITCLYIGREWLPKSEAEKTYLRQDLYQKDREHFIGTLTEIKTAVSESNRKLDTALGLPKP